MTARRGKPSESEDKMSSKRAPPRQTWETRAEREREAQLLCVERGVGLPSCMQVLYLLGALGALEDRRFWGRTGQEGETAPGLHGAGSDVTFRVVQEIFQKHGHP